MNRSNPINRRQFLGAMVAASASLPLLRMQSVNAGELPHVGGDDPMAQALGYVADAAAIDPAKTHGYKTGSRCSSCALYRGNASDAFGPCATFPGKAVSKDGWCMAYAARG